MLTRLLTTFCLRPATAAPDAAPRRGRSGSAGPADLCPAGDSASHMRALAECCADGLSALAYAQFADLLEPPPLSSQQDPEPAARSR